MVAVLGIVWFEKLDGGLVEFIALTPMVGWDIL